MLGHLSPFAARDSDAHCSTSTTTASDSDDSDSIVNSTGKLSSKLGVGVITNPKLTKNRLNAMAVSAQSMQGPLSAPVTSSSAFSFFNSSPFKTNSPSSVAASAIAAATLAAETANLDSSRNSTNDSQNAGLADILLNTPANDKFPSLTVPQLQFSDLLSPVAASPFTYSQMSLPISSQNQQSSLINSQNALSYPQIQQEEITTIFVVGFPEDMYEREFQNMFIFCPGFEAATLKIPSSADSNDDTSSASGRKQIIGFAKFRTRADAIEARNILSGRKVDAERGCVLKAEMAKKNLHTKRGLSNEAPVNPQAFAANLARRPPPGFAGLPAKDSLYAAESFNTYLGSPPQIPRELLNSPDFGFDGIDSSYLEEQNAQLLLEEQQLQKQQSQQQQQIIQQLQQAQQQQQQLQQAQQQQQQLQSQNQQLQQMPQASSAQTRQTSPSFSETNTLLENSKNYRENLYSDILDLRSMSGNLSAPTRPTFLEQRVDSPLLSTSMDQFEGSILQRSHTVSGGHIDRGFNSALYQSDSLLPQRMNDLRINTSFGLNSLTSPLSSLSNMITPNVGSPITPLSSYTPFRTGTDQNPPCNTLYVGNLPPNTSEQELLQLFSRSVGFKRLLFRSRPNGPMCFVEFDDINCATHALQELTGSLLSNSTKGGIRLSYSKNPLGVRQQQPNTPTSQQLLSPHLFLESRLIHGH